MSEVLVDFDLGDQLGDANAVVEQRILDADGSLEVAYRLVLDSGTARLLSVAVDDPPPDVVLSQSRATAEAVRAGELGALAALQAGLITLSGDVRVLVACAEALKIVDQALTHTAPDA